jgi:hypothetical protein
MEAFMQVQTPRAIGGSDITKTQLDVFSHTLSGSIVLPGSGAYETARIVWNGMIDRRPALIVLCRAVSDVISAVRFARDNELLIAVRGGGHNVAGNAVCDGGIVIDVSPMKGIRVDKETREAYAQAGLTMGEYDRETALYGLASPGGVISTTGIAGLTLGGGFGWLSRKHGLACDNLIAADVVTADGRFLTTNEGENAELFWGIRGGGGNFGIVTSFQYRLHPVKTVLAGELVHSFDDAAETLRFYRDFAESVPDELTSLVTLVTAPPAPFLPSGIHGKKAIAIGVCYCGEVTQGEKILQPLRDHGSPVADLIVPQAYHTWQAIHDPLSPPGFRRYWKSEYVGEMSDELIETLATAMQSVPSPRTGIHIHHLGGAISRVSDDATAISHRNAHFAVNVVGEWSDPSEDEIQIRWTQEIGEALRRFSVGGAYVNFLGDEGDERVKSAYGEAKFARLASLKETFDPANAFRLNQNIPPGRR